MIQRRTFLAGLASAFAAPAIVHAGNLMPVHAIAKDWIVCDGRMLSRAMYPELSAVLGSFYGGTKTTFRVPDMRGSTLARPPYISEYSPLIYQMAARDLPKLCITVGNLLPTIPQYP